MYWGAVLVGGSSRRMGRPKALIPVDGVILVERVASALQAVCDRVVAIGPAHLAGSLTCVEDRYPGEGPLGGIITALSALPDGAQGVVVAACDFPCITPAVFKALLAAANSVTTAEVVISRSSRLQPACALWMPDSRAVLQRLFDEGERSIVRTLSHLLCVEVEVDEAALVNVNTPDDLGRVCNQ